MQKSLLEPKIFKWNAFLCVRFAKLAVSFLYSLFLILLNRRVTLAVCPLLLFYQERVNPDLLLCTPKKAL